MLRSPFAKLAKDWEGIHCMEGGSFWVPFGHFSPHAALSFSFVFCVFRNFDVSSSFLFPDNGRSPLLYLSGLSLPPPLSPPLWPSATQLPTKGVHHQHTMPTFSLSLSLSAAAVDTTHAPLLSHPIPYPSQTRIPFGFHVRWIG